MGLIQLPSELLLLILSFLGTAFFRQDPRRLSICKRWYILARNVFLAEIELSRNGLDRLLHFPDRHNRLASITSRVRKVSLQLNGFERWGPADSDPNGQVVMQVALHHWTVELNEDLDALSEILRECTRLQEIIFIAYSVRHPFQPFLPRREYLNSSVLSALLTARQLTVLHLDTCGSHLLQGAQEETHICSIIGSLLSTLKRLRLRMRCICPVALRPPFDNATVPLKSLIVNLSLSKESPSVASATHSRRCGMQDESLLKLRADIEKQAATLTTLMSSPVRVRVLYHNVPSIEMRSFDVLTGKRMALTDDADWEDDGESESDEDLDQQRDLFESDSSDSFIA
ncbi:hypothetical protein PRK78_005908 [Emydomyces testavorans]|uniref:F-box domain-containing protein n=1 Tax=Emydomyces testavorans TaxID=2070801 RepID=A0AAF0DKQ3_9EURO|nr:hypothetical protein PRK78_005908 [Emydomyces testavorans]